jgi:diacylglycerol O-acyltransferase
MQSAPDKDRLSWGDALFLYLEREGMPLNIASLSVFEGTIPLQSCRSFIASKLPLIPRYYQRIAVPPFHLGLPMWEHDPEFDIRNHVRHITLKRGTDAELKAVTGAILSKLMDRSRPLWDFTLIDGLKGNRSAIVTRIHHCLADGIAGIGIMNVLMDASPTSYRVSKHKPRFRPPQPRDPLGLLLEGLIDCYSNVVDRLLTAQSDLVQLGQKLLAANGNGNGNGAANKDLLQLLSEVAAPTERLSFNVTCRGPQKFAWGEIPVSEIKAIKTACGATFNDVALALVASTIRRYAELHRNRTKGRLLRMMVPVNVRGNGTAADLGNRISLVPVTIPLDVRTPRKLVCGVHQRTQFLKNTHAAELIGFAGNLFGITPAALQAIVGPVASALPVSIFNLVCTSVPGPEFPLYFLGHKMLNWYPYVPIGGEMALNCAILSYNGMVYFGFSGDAQAVPDLPKLEKFLKESFVELQKTAGHRSKPRPLKSGNKKTRQQKKGTVAAGVRSRAAYSSPVVLRSAGPSIAAASASERSVEEAPVLLAAD